MSIMSRLAEAVPSLTSDKANTDVSAGTAVPPPTRGRYLDPIGNPSSDLSRSASPSRPEAPEPLPRAYVSRSLSSVIGRSRTRTPVAWCTAFATAAAAPTIPISPAPLAPIGLT